MTSAWTFGVAVAKRLSASAMSVCSGPRSGWIAVHTSRRTPALSPTSLVDSPSKKRLIAPAVASLSGK